MKLYNHKSIEDMEAQITTKILYSIKSATNKLVIRRYTYKFLPKEKFVRRADRTYVIGKELLAEYDILVPFTTRIEKRQRSWLGDGIQHDDIFCHEEWDEMVKDYEQPALKNFIESKLKLHQ